MNNQQVQQQKHATAKLFGLGHFNSIFMLSSLWHCFHCFCLAGKCKVRGRRLRRSDAIQSTAKTWAWVALQGCCRSNYYAVAIFALGVSAFWANGVNA